MGGQEGGEGVGEDVEGMGGGDIWEELTSVSVFHGWIGGLRYLNVLGSESKEIFVNQIGKRTLPGKKSSELRTIRRGLLVGS